MLKRIYTILPAVIIMLLAGLSCANLSNLFNTGTKTEKNAVKDTTENDNESHQICNEYKNWVRQITANDSEERVYYSFTCKDRIVFLSPYNTLLYSREGNVIGFQRDGTFHFHAPSKGWKKGVNISSVGLIKNQYEGYDGIPNLKAYKTPPTLVSK